MALHASWRRMGSPGVDLSIFEFAKDFDSRTLVSILMYFCIAVSECYDFLIECIFTETGNPLYHNEMV